MTDGNILDDKDLITRITKNLVEPTYYNDVQTNISARKTWKQISDYTSATSKCFSGVSTILAFAAGFFQCMILSFIAGCFGTISLVLSHCSSYASAQCEKVTTDVNKILSELKITELVDVVTDPIISNMSN